MTGSLTRTVPDYIHLGWVRPQRLSGRNMRRVSLSLPSPPGLAAKAGIRDAGHVASKVSFLGCKH